MVTDLRAIDKVIQPVGSLLSGILLPSLLPTWLSVIVIDLNDGFFSMLLQQVRENLPSQWLLTIIPCLLKDISGKFLHKELYRGTVSIFCTAAIGNNL